MSGDPCKHKTGGCCLIAEEKVLQEN